MNESSLAIDLARQQRAIVEFIRREVEDAGATGVVLGMSGGVDSSVTCTLCARALGKGRVLGLLMPTDHTPAGDRKDARELASSLGIETREVDIGRLVKCFRQAVGTKGTKLASANIQARLRMAILYYHANSTGRLVVGTGDRSEIQIGYFTKYGDGGADILPIGHLYKTQVRALGELLGLPKRVTQKPSSPRLWPGHRATDEIPADYDRLDLVLHCLFDLGLSSEEAARRAGVDSSIVEKVKRMHSMSSHKRAPPHMPRT